MKKALVLSVVLGALSGGVHAQVYLGGSYGLGQTDLNCDGALFRCSKHNAGYHFVGGLKLGPSSAIEIGQTHFGTKQITVSGADYYGPYVIDGELDLQATTIAVVGRFDIQPSAAVVLKLGASKVKATLASYYQSEKLDATSESKNSFYWAVGLEHALGAQLKTTVTAEFTKGQVLDETIDGKLLSFGLQYQF